MALYAVNHEIARTADVVKEAAVGAVRLAWWRDALVGISAGQAAGAHPALAAFAASAPASGWPVDTLMTLIEARARDLEAAPFQTLGDIETDCDATAGGGPERNATSSVVASPNSRSSTRAGALAN